MSDLSNKVIFVTGVGSGIGKAAASLFAAAGATVAGVDVNKALGQEVMASIQEKGYPAQFYPADLTSESEVNEVINSFIAQFQKIDGAFNVVGGSGRRHGDGPIHTCTEAGWDWTLDLNLKSMFFCCKYLTAHMLEKGGGSIVNLSSVLGLVGGDEDFGTHAYAASKGAVISMSRAMASYYASRQIRVNVLCPSLIATGMSKRAQESEHIHSRLPALQPLTANFGTPADVAQAALYFLSDHARFVTGAVLTVDGGWTVR